MTNNTDIINIGRLVIKLADGLIFGLFAGIISYTVFYAMLGLSSEFALSIIFTSLCVWLAVALVGYSRRTVAVTIIIVAITVLLWVLFGDVQAAFAHVSDYYDWLMSSSPSQEIFTDEQYGFTYRLMVFGAVCIATLPFYIYKNFSKLIALLAVTVLVVFFSLSYIYTRLDFTYLFVPLLPMLFYMHSRAVYHLHGKPADDLLEYLLFMCRKTAPSFVPTAILCVTLFFLPLQYRNDPLIVAVNDTAYAIVSEVDFLGRLVSRFSGVDTNTQLLGGNLTQSGEVQFKVKASEPLLLRTDVFYEYTGNSFVSTEQQQELEFSPDSAVPEGNEFYRGTGSYTVQMERYNSRMIPLALNYKSIYGGDGTFSKNQFGEVQYQHYFIEGEQFTVEYDMANYSLLEVFRYALREISREEYVVPSEALTQLPSTVTDRTHDLANDILEYSKERMAYFDAYPVSKQTRTAFEHYFTAHIMSAYLQGAYSYSTAPGGIVGEDFVDSFLFESGEGYCTSFAASLYVMLQAIDIPCRYVTGYVVREVEEDEFVEVSDLNRHSWVEVYIQDLGYVPLDPTPAGSTGSGTAPAILGEAPQDDYAQEEALTEDPMPDMVQDTDEQTVTQQSTKNPVTQFLSTFPWVLPVLIALAVFVGCIKFTKYALRRYITRKDAQIKRMLDATDIETVYTSLTGLLATVDLRQRENESLRAFMIRVYDYYYPFGVDETHTRGRRKTKLDTYSEYEKPLSRNMQSIITLLEEYSYSQSGYSGDIDTLIHFRDHVNAHVKRTRRPIVYTVTFKVG